MTNKPRKAWSVFSPRFSLRTLLAMILLMSVVFGLGVPWIRKTRERGEAQLAVVAQRTPNAPRLSRKALSRNRVSVYYASEKNPPWWARTVRASVHTEYERRLSHIEIFGSRYDIETASNIANVFGVNSLTFTGKFSETWLTKAVSARGMRSLTLGGHIEYQPDVPSIDGHAPPSDLEWLRIKGLGKVRPEYVEWLCRAPKLTKLTLDRVDPGALPSFATAPNLIELELVSEEGSNRTLLFQKPQPIRASIGRPLQEFFDRLAERSELKTLRLRSVTIADPDFVKKFCESSAITSLQLEFCNVSPACLREFAKLRNLEELALNWTPLAPEDVEILAAMKSVRNMHGVWCGDEEAEEYLCNALPQCEITFHQNRSPMQIWNDR